VATSLEEEEEFIWVITEDSTVATSLEEEEFIWVITEDSTDIPVVCNTFIMIRTIP
jgi:hypothetical protein